MKTKAGWTYCVDNRIANYGECDLERRIIRINRNRHHRDGEPLIDTIVHEIMHKRFPHLSERAIVQKTTRSVPRLSRRTKQRLYRLFHAV